MKIRFKINFFFAFVLLLIFGASFSSSDVVDVGVIESKFIANGEEIYLGKVARGQAFTITISPFVEEGGRFGRGGRYDIAYAKNLPEGWESKESSLYGNPLEVLVVVPNDAEYGEYSFIIFLEDENNFEGLETKWFLAKVEVVEDSFDMEASLFSKEVGVGNPVNLKVEVENKVDFGNTYYVSISSLNYFERRVFYVPPKSKEEFVFSLSFPKEGVYEIKVSAGEKNNVERGIEKILYVEVRESLLSEYKSIGEGIMLVPISQALAYYISYLISLAFPS